MAELPDAPWATKELPDAPWVKAPAAVPQEDYGKLVPSAAARGVTSGLGLPGDVREYLAGKISQGSKALGYEIPQSAASTALKFVPVPGAGGATSEQLKGGVESVTGPLYEPKTTAGKFINAGVESVANPASYIGPGGILLKTGGAILSGLGGEAGKEAMAGTKLEPYGQIVGALLAGTAAAKTMGPTAAKAATPTAAELKAAAVSGGQHGGYNAALNSGLELDPKGVAGWSQNVRQGLFNDGLTGGQNGTAPKTWAVLDAFDKAPAGGIVTPQGIDAARKTLGKISRETQPTQGGAIVATNDAAAAQQALRELGTYVENIPAGHILAGDAAAYANATKEANKNYAAYARTRDIESRFDKANLAAEGQIAGSLENQLKAKARQVLTNSAGRSYTPEEQAQARLLNSGGPISNTLRTLGRGGAGVIPMVTHLAAAALTGGGSIGPSLAIGVPLYAARKASEAITKNRAAKLAEMLAQRSPEYEARVNALPNVDTSPNKAAIARALLGAF